MDQGLKQRLVGAVVLVSLAVILVPMVLQVPDPDLPALSSPVPVGPIDEAAITAPAEAGPDQIPLAVPEVAAEPQPSTGGEPSTPSEVAEFLEGAEASPPIQGAAKPEGAAPGEAASPHPAVASPPKGEEQKKPASMVRQAHHENESASPTLVLLDPRLRGGEGRGPKGAAQKDAVKEPTKAQLETVAPHGAAPKGVGKAGTAVPPADAATVAKERPGAWVVQLGSFSKEENARALDKQLRTAGFKSYVDKVRGAAEPRFRVRIGPDLSERDAERVVERLRRDLAMKGIVVHYP